MAVVKDKLKYYYRDDAEKIIIEQAPGPKEIIWHNLKRTSTKKLRVMVGWAMSLGFLVLALAVFYGINMFKASLIATA